MKRFLLSLVVLVAFTGVTFADPGDPTLAPEVTVESVDDSVTTTLEVACQYAMNTAAPVGMELGPRADDVMYTFQSSLSFLATEGVDAGELSLLFEEAGKDYREARASFSKGVLFIDLANLFVDEAEDAEGAEAYALRTRAASCYYEAGTYFERAKASLDTVIALGVKGEAVAKELKILPPAPTEDRVVGRYHLRSRVNRFFSRSRGRRV